ncbi:pyruvate:ferredoxin (flavodoxin) oxidoreductase, partial [Eubacteriales bacterium OttesenSCG-928-G02]|nr:pyruvate:ferredoxin (flavodoxin) oxidoreductase [Eubacteriales bacterium OttesenSCG-928-G02]
KRGEKVGLLKVRLYRPFSISHFINEIPKTVKKIAVLDRTKEPGAIGEPLYIDVINAIRGTEFESATVVGGRYGLGSKDTTPAAILSVYKNLDAAKPVNGFTISIDDDITNLSLPIDENPSTAPEGTISCKFWGLGADGTVSANKNSIKIIGDHTDKYIQAYFAYDSKKSGGITISHLRFGDKPIRSTYYISHADFVACHNPSYINMYDITEDIKEGGTFLLNCQWSVEELDEKLPAKVKRDIANKHANFYIVDAISIARELGLGGRTNTVLQSAFFKLANIIPADEAIDYMKKAAHKSFIKKGQAVVDMNYAAIDKGASAAVKVEVPASWATATDAANNEQPIEGRKEIVDYVKNIMIPTNAQKGDSLPVSAFVGAEDGTFPQGSAAYEKRGVAVDVPCWNSENCIQCNFCSFVCPHATIRPVAMTDEEAAQFPEMKLTDMTGMPGYKFGMTVSPLDCLGCGSCVQICPGKKGAKALEMKPLESQLEEQKYFAESYKYCDNEKVLEKFKPETVKGSQFKQPLLEFSGACAGCGETPYAKLITQLFGDRMFIANATGCSSIWGGSAPSTPYTLNKEGKGPAWANSLFEDNAEFGLGMAVAQNQRREKLVEIITTFANSEYDVINSASKEWLATKDDGKLSKESSAKLIAAVEKANSECGSCGCEFDALYTQVLEMKDLLVKKSFWIFGGDGWAYDIGFGGLDHALASGDDINIFVFDTEVYSNTGGQASKSTPTGSTAQFATAGKGQKKKDLASIAMSYGYVYVAQVAMGADYNQCIKAIVEAENYKGPSIVIGYAPCINHGIKKGLGTSMLETKAAVAAGYWHNFRYNPMLAQEGKNPFQLDSKEPTTSYVDFIKSESRYSSLELFFPERATVLFGEAEIQAKEKYAKLKKLAE